MKKVLNLQSSIFSEAGQSYQLSEKFLETLRAEIPGVEVTTRDLAKNPIPHLDGAQVMASMTPEADRTDEQKLRANYTSDIISELEAHDTILIGMPMYNFTVPSTLKAWIDQVAQAGRTFKYTESGVEGLVKGKKVYVIMTMGGTYKGTDLDTQSSYIKTFFGLIGITDVEIIYAEGLNLGDDIKNAALNAAHSTMDNLIKLAA